MGATTLEDYRLIRPANLNGAEHAQHRSNPPHPRLTQRSGRPYTKAVCGKPSGYLFERLTQSFSLTSPRACRRCVRIIKKALEPA